MKAAKTTRHFQIDRKDRVNFIIDLFNGDFGTPLCDYSAENDTVRKVMTDKGVVLVYGKNNNVIITMYLATVKQATFLYRAAHGTNRTPESFLARVRKNQKYVTKM